MELNSKNVLDPWKIQIQEITTFSVPLPFENTLFPYIAWKEVEYEVEYGMKTPKILTVVKHSPDKLFDKKDDRWCLGTWHPEQYTLKIENLFPMKVEEKMTTIVSSHIIFSSFEI